MSDTVRTKLCYEELLDKFNTAGGQWLKETPEARGLILVVDWAVGKNEFPPCTVLSKELTEQSIIDMMRQSARLMEHLSSIFKQQIDKADSILSQATAIVTAVATEQEKKS